MRPVEAAKSILYTADAAGRGIESVDVMTGSTDARRRIESMGFLTRLRLAAQLVRDPRVPTWAKAIVPGLAALYVLLPIDLIPDLLLGIGQIDDLGVVGIALLMMTRLLPRLTSNTVLLDHLDQFASRDSGRKGTEQRDVIETSFRVVERDKER